MPADEQAIALALDVADAADDRKATDVVILEVVDVLAVVDLFLIATATSDRQLKAVAESIEQRAQEGHGRKPQRREGRPDSGWLLLDFGDVVCHLFAEEQREFYSLERLWADVPRIELSSGRRVDAVAHTGSAEEA